MTVERTQTRGLAAQSRRRRRRRGAVAEQFFEERRHRGAIGGERANPTAGEEHAELEQVDAVGLTRVARQPARPLKMSQEVEHKLLEGLSSVSRNGSHNALFVGVVAIPARSQAGRDLVVMVVSVTS